MSTPVRHWQAWALGVALCACAGQALAAVSVPVLKAHVTDTTATLSEQQKSVLEDKLRALEQRNGAQLLILIVPTTHPETIEQFATRVFDAWKPGRSGIDDGVLLLWAKNDRTLRIEVGYGLEGALPDVEAGRIIADTLRPRFRGQLYAAGLDLATDQLIGLIDGEARSSARTSRGGTRYPIGDFIDRYFPAVFAFPFVIGIVFCWPKGREFSAALTATVIGTGVTWKMDYLPPELLPGAAFLYFLSGLVFAFNLIPFARIARGFASGDGMGGWSGGGGGGGGSWSGGGGRSGGGGASGSY